MSKFTKEYADKFTTASLAKIRANASAEYKSKVGNFELGDNLTDFGKPIITYTTVMNEFITSLVQLIAFPLFQSHMWNNRLKSLKKGNKPYGFSIEDIYTNPVKPTQYNANDFSRILKGTKQDTITAFYQENRHDVFQKTITKDMLRGAFRDSVAWLEFVNSLVEAIKAGNEIAEYNLTKRAINECYDASMFKSTPMVINTTEGIENAIIDVKNAYDYFQFPSTKYNNYAVFSGTGKEAEVWTNPEDIVVIATVEALNKIKVKYLAGVFNLSEVEFRDRLIVVDSFDWDEYETDTDGVTGKLKEHHASDIEMVVCDSGLFQIYDTMEVSVDFFNAGNLATNYFLHVWQTYGMRPWANALVFTKEVEPEGPIAVTSDPSTYVFEDTVPKALTFYDKNNEVVKITNANVTFECTYDDAPATKPYSAYFKVDVGANGVAKINPITGTGAIETGHHATLNVSIPQATATFSYTRN